MILCRQHGLKQRGARSRVADDEYGILRKAH
jgi:hypothetical protein